VEKQKDVHTNTMTPTFKKAKLKYRSFRAAATVVSGGTLGAPPLLGATVCLVVVPASVVSFVVVALVTLQARKRSFQ
jgi:hypothetical protein